MFRAQRPGDPPARWRREILLRRPPRLSAPPSSLPGLTWWARCRTILLAFIRQVLLRPTRIGTLVVLGTLIAIVVGGAESWWFLLGVTLFHAAAATLVVLWVQVPAAPTARPGSGRAGRCCPGVRCPLPRQRRPQPGG